LALARKPELDTRRRLELILSRINPLRASGDKLRLLRSIQILERIGTSEARVPLRTLSGGVAGPRLATAARDALGRLDRAARR
jgi:hypothetical protein